MDKNVGHLPIFALSKYCLARVKYPDVQPQEKKCKGTSYLQKNKGKQEGKGALFKWPLPFLIQCSLRSSFAC